MYEGLAWSSLAEDMAQRRIFWDTRRSNHFPSWSWIGWTGSIHHPFTMLNEPPDISVEDKHNIVLSAPQWQSYIPPPAGYLMESTYQSDVHGEVFWVPWPQKTLQLCPSDANDEVTIHLMASTIPVLLTPSSKAGQGSTVEVSVATTSVPSKEIGKTRVDRDLLLQQEKGCMFEVLIWGYHVFINSPGILIRKRDELFHERASPWLVDLNPGREVTGELIRMRQIKYVRLR